MVLFCCSSPDEEKARRYAVELKKRLGGELLINNREDFLLSEPFPAPLQKKEGYFRYHIVYKGENLHRFAGGIRETIWNFRKELREDVRVTVDFNPQIML